MNLGSGEVLVILLVALLVLGPTRLPEAARQVGKTMRTIRQVSTGFQDEMRHAIEDTIEADAARDAGVSHTPASRPGARRPAPPAEDDRPDPGGPTDLTAAGATETADAETADAETADAETADAASATETAGADRDEADADDPDSTTRGESSD